MYLWRRTAGQRWLSEKEPRLQALAGDRLAIIERADRKRLQIEVASKSRTELESLVKQFGGRVRKLPRDWLQQSLRRKTKPIQIGTRKLIIPAGAAFGTGEHATTTMCLRLLEKLTRGWKPGWSIVDLGTGSGILALAARHLGAKRVIGIDNDLIAIATAKENARLNKIESIQWRVGDARRWKLKAKSRLRQGSGAQVDIVTANLFSGLLIEILPKLKAARWLILSGVLRAQELDLRRALTGHKIDIVQLRRRGKWVAMLTRRT